jgi:hypothetical protein
MATDWKAMQYAGSKKKDKENKGGPTDVKTKYMSMGSWKASLSAGGAYRGKK